MKMYEFATLIQHDMTMVVVLAEQHARENVLAAWAWDAASLNRSTHYTHTGMISFVFKIGYCLIKTCTLLIKMNCYFLCDAFLACARCDARKTAKPRSYKINYSRWVSGEAEMENKYRSITLPQLTKHVIHLCEEAALPLMRKKAWTRRQINPNAALRMSRSSLKTAVNTHCGYWWAMFANPVSLRNEKSRDDFCLDKRLAWMFALALEMPSLSRNSITLTFSSQQLPDSVLAALPLLVLSLCVPSSLKAKPLSERPPPHVSVPGFRDCVCTWMPCRPHDFSFY